MKRIGLLGCGAIGGELARRLVADDSFPGRISGVYDKILSRAKHLASALGHPDWICRRLDELFQRSHIIVEAVASEHTHHLIRRALKSRCDVLCLSVGAVWLHPSLIRLAQDLKRRLVIPSGAVAGLDGIKAAAAGRIKKIRLTTRKPPQGLQGNLYLKEKRINLSRLTKPRVVFEGNVTEAVRHFPRNINVAAAIGLAAGEIPDYRITIVADPKLRRNQHTIEMTGDFGRLTSRVTNVALANNPRTSRLAAYSALTALREMCEASFRVGT